MEEITIERWQLRLLNMLLDQEIMERPHDDKQTQKIREELSDKLTDFLRIASRENKDKIKLDML